MADSDDELISPGPDYLAARRMREAMRVLNGTTKARVALLTGVAPEEIDRLGGIDEWGPGKGNA